MKILRYIFVILALSIAVLTLSITMFAPTTEKKYQPQAPAELMEATSVTNIEESLEKTEPTEKISKCSKLTEEEAVTVLFKHLHYDEETFLPPTFYDTGRYHGYEFALSGDSANTQVIERDEILSDDSFFIFNSYTKSYNTGNEVTQTSMQGNFAVNQYTKEIIEEHIPSPDGSWIFNNDYAKVLPYVEFTSDPNKLTEEEAIRVILNYLYNGDVEFSSDFLFDDMYYHGYEMPLPWTEDPNVVQRLEYISTLRGELYFTFGFYTRTYGELDNGKKFYMGEILNNYFAVNRETKEVIKQNLSENNEDWIYNDEYASLWNSEEKVNRIDEKKAVEILLQYLYVGEINSSITTFYDDGSYHGYEFVLPWTNGTVLRLECDESMDDSLFYIFKFYERINDYDYRAVRASCNTSFAVNRKTQQIFQENGKIEAKLLIYDIDTEKSDANGLGEAMSKQDELTEKEAAEVLFKYFYGDVADTVLTHFYDTKDASGCEFILPWDEANLQDLQRDVHGKSDSYFKFESRKKIYDKDGNFVKSGTKGSFLVNRVTNEITPERLVGENGEWILNDAYRQILLAQ